MGASKTVTYLRGAQAPGTQGAGMAAMVKINKKIKGYSVVRPNDLQSADVTAPAVPAPAESKFTQMTEKVERPEMLVGSTYKMKSPLFEHALYVTVNDIVLNEGTPHEQRRPFEVFINSKNMEHFQWIVALTRIMSAVFRKGGDVTFLVAELKAVFDPRGGYFKPGGTYMPSIVAELGAIIERHMKIIGLISDPEMDAAQRALIQEKRSTYEKSMATADGSHVAKTDEDGVSAFPPSATFCAKCSTKAVVLMDGCATCLNCGNSKCG
jgi:hypothetical protein